MPTYDYECENGHRFELFHGIKDETPKTCPQCGAPSKRVPAGGGGILFKGSGFYATDYRSESWRKGAKADTGGTGTGGTPPPAGDKGGPGAGPAPPKPPGKP